METKAPLAPITIKRTIRDDLEDKIPKPYLARALVAPDVEHASETPTRHRGLSVLQQHVSFFDQNNDGVIYPLETCMAMRFDENELIEEDISKSLGHCNLEGLRKLGFSMFCSFILTLFFHLAFSYPTLPGFIPHILLPIYITNIHKAKYGSDTGVYDTEGRFIPASFENMFSKYAHTSPDKMTRMEVWNMTEGNRAAYDISGWIFSKAKWGLLYCLAKDDDGFLHKETLRGMFDGSLFESYAKNSKNH